MQLSSKDLRFHTKSALDAVKRGEQINITFHGKVIAVMISPEHINTITQKVNVKEVAGFGMWADRKDIADTNNYIQKIRQPRYIF